MQALQPMHADLSKSTRPSARWYMAVVGHAATHGAFSHMLQRVTWKARRACGHVPMSTDLTYVRGTPSGTSFSDLHAVVHAWHPMQRVWSRTLTQRGAVSISARTPGRSPVSVVVDPFPAACKRAPVAGQT